MSNITLLDGGMGQELVHRSGDVPTPLWSTQVMIDHPGMVAGVHRDFAQAGATVATANTYALHHDRLRGTPHEGNLKPLFGAALSEAREVASNSRIAGALGPLGASYRPDLLPEHSIAVQLYAEGAAMLAPACDLLICETVSSIAHGRAVLEAAVGTGKPVWVAFSVLDEDGTRLRSGEALTDILPLIAEQQPEAVLLNCSTPEAISAGLPTLADTGLPYGAYANGFEKISDGFKKDRPTVDALATRHDFTPEAYADFALGWVDQGASIVGGCCEVSPAHIAEIATRLRAAGHTIV
jgi:homocysteine S-methyltransferase